jgi:hypothetical protein
MCSGRSYRRIEEIGMISTELFPYTSFPIRLEFMEGKHSRVCYFQDKTHLNKYLIKHKINKKTANILYNEET